MISHTRETSETCMTCEGTGLKLDENGIAEDDPCPKCWGSGMVEVDA